MCFVPSLSLPLCLPILILIQLDFKCFALVQIIEASLKLAFIFPSAAIKVQDVLVSRLGVIIRNIYVKLCTVSGFHTGFFCLGGKHF